MLTLVTVALLMMVVHFIGTIAYSPRVTGVITGRLSLSMSLSNILNMLSRAASVMMIPLLSKRIENSLGSHATAQPVPNNYLVLLFFALAGSLLGFICFRAAIGVIYRTVTAYTPHANIILLLLRALLPGAAIAPPLKAQLTAFSKTDWRYLVLNLLITCVYTSATLAAIYSAYRAPQYRLTSLSFAFLINGAATLVYVTMVDPYVSSLTDLAMARPELIPRFYYRIRWFLYSRMAGVVLALLTFKLFLFLIVFCVGIMK